MRVRYYETCQQSVYFLMLQDALNEDTARRKGKSPSPSELRKFNRTDVLKTLVAADEALALPKQAMKFLTERNGRCQSCWSDQGKLKAILLLQTFVSKTRSQGAKCKQVTSGNFLLSYVAFTGQVIHPSKGWKNKHNLREETCSPCIRFWQHFKEISELLNKKEVTF